MKDKHKRKDFLKWAKAEYHAEPFQLQRQKEDWQELAEERKAKDKHRKRMKARWTRELQRRLGSPAMWHMVSFTGKVDLNVLRQVSNDGSTQTVEGNREPTQDLTRTAQKARDRLRYAESLRRSQQAGRRRFSAQEQAELALLADGSLLTQANDATRRSGFGRIKNEDGTYEDIAPHGGGIVRTILDHVEPNPEDEIAWTE